MTDVTGTPYDSKEEQAPDVLNQSDDKQVTFGPDEDVIKPPTLQDDEIPIENIAPDTEIKEDSFDDLFLIPVMVTCTPEEATAQIKLIRDSYTDEEFIGALNNPLSPFNGFRKIVESANSAEDFNRSRLKNVDCKALSRNYSKGDVRLFDATPIATADRGGQIVSGDEAKMLVQARNRSIRRCYLYNSGFDITIKGPSLSELNNYYNQVSSEKAEYGKEYGAYYYMFSDIVIKKATIDLMQNLITNASIKNWKRGTNLLKSISLADYDSIIWIIGTLMFKKGFTYQFICSNFEDKCNYTEITEIDLKKLRYNNYGMLNEEAIKILNSIEPKSVKDLLQYQSALGLSRKIFLYDDMYAITKVPSLFDYMEYAAAYNASLLEHIHVGDRDNIYRYIQFNYYRAFVPWISEIQVMHENSESINFRITDQNAISEVLDVAQLEKSNFGVDMENFIKSASISHIAIPFSGCPKCKYVPKQVVDGFLPFDVQQNFFTQTVMRMAQGI